MKAIKKQYYGGCIFDNISESQAVRFDTHEEAFREIKHIGSVGISVTNVGTEFIDGKYILVRNIF